MKTTSVKTKVEQGASKEIKRTVGKRKQRLIDSSFAARTCKSPGKK